MSSFLCPASSESPFTNFNNAMNEQQTTNETMTLQTVSTKLTDADMTRANTNATAADMMIMNNTLFFM